MESSGGGVSFTPDEAWMIRAEYERHLKRNPSAKDEVVTKLLAHRLGARRLGPGRYSLKDIPAMEAVVMEVLTSGI